MTAGATTARSPGSEATAPSADQTSARILDAALEQFELLGLRRSTIDDVARRAGVSRITVYRRFARKDRLVEAVIMRELERFLAELDTAVMVLGSVEERMIEGFVVTLRSARHHLLLGRLLRAEPELLLPHLTQRAGVALAMASAFLAERIRDAQDLGDIPAFDAQQVAELVVRLTLSFILTPDSSIALEDELAMRAFARRYVAPLVTRAEPNR
ncbi:MAG: TetR/AcrR family transcriptional regulator [Solirubrobacteraceae bacterium]|nr:MAG: TetR family transcriptional regulator [Solirubrobacterales bacterium]